MYEKIQKIKLKLYIARSRIHREYNNQPYTELIIANNSQVISGNFIISFEIREKSILLQPATVPTFPTSPRLSQDCLVQTFLFLPWLRLLQLQPCTDAKHAVTELPTERKSKGDKSEHQLTLWTYLVLSSSNVSATW